MQHLVTLHRFTGNVSVLHTHIGNERRTSTQIVLLTTTATAHVSKRRPFLLLVPSLLSCSLFWDHAQSKRDKLHILVRKSRSSEGKNFDAELAERA